MNVQEKLLNYLTKAIENYQLKIKEITSSNNSSLTKYQKELKELETMDNLTTIDFNIVKEVIEELNIKIEEKQKLTKFLETIKTLLTFNKEQHTTYEISESQTNSYQSFLNTIKKKQTEIKNTENKNKKYLDKITNRSNKYRSLLGLLEDKENLNFITDLDLIATLFKEQEVSSEDRREILISLMEYNQEIYNRSLKIDFSKRPLKRLNIEDVKAIFEKHNYDFNLLKETYQENILNYGDLTNIKELLTLLDKYHFNRFNLEKEGLKLITILINCDKQTFTNIVEFSQKKGIYPNELLKIIPVLIGQDKHKRRQAKEENLTSPLNETPIISGKSADYVKNVDFLESIGFDIKYIYNKCKELLLMSNSRLVSNYKLFKEYGFEFQTDEVGNLTHPALTCLMSNNFAEVVDQFIEVSPRGLDYLKNNMSRILVYPDPKSLIFYNIYASYQTDDNFKVAEGPFVNNNSTNPRLRGEITRYNGSGYEKIPYRGIEEENKELKTNTIIPNIINKETFDLAVETNKALGEELKDLVSRATELENLEEYTDESNHLKYNFNGVNISKPKVKRIYNILKNHNLEDLENSLLYSITYNTIITEADYEKIKDIVKSRRK